MSGKDMCTYTFQALYERPDYVVAFMTISNWSGFSRRSGVWTYYETAAPADLEGTIPFD